MSDSFVESNENTTVFYIDAEGFYGWTTSDVLPSGDNLVNENLILQETLDIDCVNLHILLKLISSTLIKPKKTKKFPF